MDKNRFPITHYEVMKKNVPVFWDFIEFIRKEIGDQPVDFNIFARWMEKNNTFLGLVEKYGADYVQLFARQVYHSWMMQCCGEKIYYMSREVCDLINNTNLTIDAEFIEAPFQQIYIYTDQEELILSDARDSAPMKGLYLSLKKEMDGKKFIRFIATSSSDRIFNKTDVNYFATFEIPEHGKLEDIANNEINKYMENNTVFNKVNMVMLKRMFIFCVNSLLYIGCRNIDLINFTPANIEEELARKKSASKKAKLERQIGKYNQYPYIIIQLKRQYNTDGTVCEGKKLDHQVMVSGYWRGQWYGPRDGERKKEVIRIQSYVKGLGLKETESKKFIVK